MRERTSFDVLPGQTDTIAFLQKRTESQTLHCRHIKSVIIRIVLSSFLIDLLDRLMYVKVVRPLRHVLEHLIKVRLFDTSLGGGDLLNGIELIPIQRLPLFVDFPTLGGLIGLLILGQFLILGRFDLRLSHDPLADQLLAVLLEHRLHFFDFFVHQGLSEERLVELVVAKPSVADYIDEDVLVEFVAVFVGDLHALVQQIGLVCVHVEDWSAHHLGNLRAVVGGAGLVLIGGESDLVVHDNMNDASGCVILQILHLQRFVDDSLSSDSGITVYYDRHSLSLCIFRNYILDGSDSPIHQGVDCLQVRGVGDNREKHLLPCDFLLSGHADMVLDVSRGLLQLLFGALWLFFGGGFLFRLEELL